MKKYSYLFFFLLMIVIILWTKHIFQDKSTIKIADKERPFVLFVSSPNQETLDSIFSQEYQNYHVVYVSNDSSEALYKDAFFGEKNRTLIHNRKEPLSPLHTLYKIVQACSNETIIIPLYKQKRLAHTSVLKDLNTIYANKKVWMTYEPPLSKSNRAYLQTFYAGLFKKAPLSDLVVHGSFFTSDLAITSSMLDMAKGHAHIPSNTLFYKSPIYEDVGPINKPACPPLKEDPSKPFPDPGPADLLVFSYNRPMQLYAFLESTMKHISHWRKIAVIYRQDPPFVSGYENVKKAFPHVAFFKQSSKYPKKDFKSLVIKTLFGSFGKGSSYVAFAVDDIIITDKIDLLQDTKKLQQTGAYGLYYRLGLHVDYCYMLNKHQGIPKLFSVADGYFAWQFKQGDGDWNYPNSVDLVLYNKQEIKKEITSLPFTFPNDFEGAWHQLANPNKIGLCSQRAKMVNIPMNLVSNKSNRSNNTFTVEQLNTLFLRGLKIDIQPFYLILNRGAHADIMPQFIPRNAND